MNRYKHTSKKRDEKLKQQVLKPTIYPKIPLRDSDIFMPVIYMTLIKSVRISMFNYLPYF